MCRFACVMKPLIPLLIFLLFTHVCPTAFGRIGESSMQCFKRYGRVEEEKNLGDAKQIKFRSGNFTVTGVFVADKAEFLEFQKSGELAEAEMGSLLEKNGIAVSLAEENREMVPIGRTSVGEKITWTFPDRIAIFDPRTNTLTICTMTFAGAVRSGSESAEKQKASESLDGF